MTTCSSYSCLENSMDRGAGRLQSIGLQKSQTWLSDWAHTYTQREAGGEIVPSWEDHVASPSLWSHHPGRPECTETQSNINYLMLWTFIWDHWSWVSGLCSWRYLLFNNAHHSESDHTISPRALYLSSLVFYKKLNTYFLTLTKRTTHFQSEYEFLVNIIHSNINLFPILFTTLF